jgi:hypothetical protein
MGSKLDEAHQELTYIAAALRAHPVETLDEAKKKPGELSRKERKQQEKQNALYRGKAPMNQDSGRPYVPESKSKSKSPPVSRPTVPTTPIAPPSAAAVRIISAPPAPPTPVKIVAPEKPAEKPKAERSTPRAPKIEPKAEPQSLLSRISKRVLPGFLGGQEKPASDEPKAPHASRLGQIKGFLKSLKDRLFGRKRLDSDVSMPRTLMALRLTEERSSTTFKPCKDRAMVSTAHLRHTLPKPWFVKPDEENPTFPVRTDCRSSLAALGRAIQPDMANPDEAIVNSVLRRVNSTTGGTRGRLNLRLWGTGRGGQRMETYRGAPGTPKRTDTLAKKLGISKKEASALHGISTGRADNQKHTSPYSPPGGSKGPAGNREVPRHPLAHAKAPVKSSGKKAKRTEKREAGKIGRGLARIGR